MSEQTNSKNPPEGYKTINSYLTVEDVPQLVQFLERAFGGIVTEQIRQPDGRIEHVEMRLGDSLLMIGPPQVDSLVGTQTNHRAATFYVFVADVDATYEQALTSGATAWEDPAEMYYGDRVAAVTDASGNRWWIATRKRTLKGYQLQELANERWQKGIRAVRKSVTKADLLEFIRGHRYAVEASTAADGSPEAALVGIVINDALELVFDSFDSTRKVANLRRNPRVAFVIGGQTVGDARTVQYEGAVDVPGAAELEQYKKDYFTAHPDGLRRSKLSGIRYFRVRPRWIRYTNFNAAPEIVVFEGAALSADHRVEGHTDAPPYSHPSAPWQPRIEPEREFNAFSSPRPGEGASTGGVV